MIFKRISALGLKGSLKFFFALDGPLAYCDILPAMDHDHPETLLDRRDLKARWKVSLSTIKRRERAGLTALHLSPRSVRFTESEIRRYESESASRKTN